MLNFLGFMCAVIDMKRLLNFSITSLDDMEQKGNMLYTKHYTTYFDDVINLYLWGSRKRQIASGNVKFVCVGTGHGARDLLLSPVRTLCKSLAVKPTHFMTADLIYGWWHALFLFVWLRTDIVVMPVCTPPEIIKNSGRTYSGHHPLIEKTLINLTFLMAKRIIVARNSGATREWLEGLWCRSKVRVVNATPEELPSVEFYDRLKDLEGNSQPKDQCGSRVKKLIYVGRLEREKLVADLIEAASLLKQAGKSFKLTIVGDGSERASMERRAQEVGVSDLVSFRGFLNAAAVAEQLVESDIFVSTLTGTSIKEAAFCRVALVAYAIDYMPGLFTDGENCLLVDGGNTRKLAEKVALLIDDDVLRSELADNLNLFAKSRWTLEAVRLGLEQAFGDI